MARLRTPGLEGKALSCLPVCLHSIRNWGWETDLTGLPDRFLPPLPGSLIVHLYNGLVRPLLLRGEVVALTIGLLLKFHTHSSHGGFSALRARKRDGRCLLWVFLYMRHKSSEVSESVKRNQE